MGYELQLDGRLSDVVPIYTREGFDLSIDGRRAALRPRRPEGRTRCVPPPDPATIPHAMSDSIEWSAPTHDLPPGTSAKFPLRWRGRRVEAFVVNFDGRFHAYVNQCIHAGTPLDWWPNEFFTDDGLLLVCATHGAYYEPDSGECVDGPPCGRLLFRVPLRIAGDRIFARCPTDEIE